MKLITFWTKGCEYEFRYLERTDTLQVSKENTFKYTARKQRNGTYRCDCPGGRYHNKCWHVTMIPALKSLLPLHEPWADWAEEAQEMMEQRRDYVL